MEKVALITGIRRVGLEVAKHLLRNEYNLCVNYLSSEDSFRELERLSKELGRRVVPFKGSLETQKACEEFVNAAVEELGRMDVFVHLASPYVRTPIEELSERDIETHFKPIVQSFLLVSKYAFGVMLRNENEVKGRILAFGDWAVEHTPYRGYSAYFLAKGALHTSVKVLAKEFSPHVLVNCIALGPTLKAEELTEEEWERILRNTPLRRQVSMKDVINLMNFLLDSDSMTGEILMLDGGRHIAGSGLGSVG